MRGKIEQPFAVLLNNDLQEETRKSASRENEHLSGVLGQLPDHTLGSVFQTNCSVASSVNRLQTLPRLLAFHKIKLPV